MLGGAEHRFTPERGGVAEPRGGAGAGVAAAATGANG